MSFVPGAGDEKYVAYTSFIFAKSFMSSRYTVERTTASNEVPAAVRISPMLRKTRCVCAEMSPSTRLPVAGSIGTWPETKSRLPALMAWEYGPMAFGADVEDTAWRIRGSMRL